MISDITLGQYFPGDSCIHKLDPRTKIILTVLFIVTVFLVNTPLGFLTILLSVISLILLSRISIRVILKGVKPIIYVLIFTALINLFMTKGESQPLVDFYFIEIYKEGIIRAVFMALRVILLIIGTSVLLTYTTSPISLTDGIESLLSPLKKIKIPVHVFAMMMTIALRFIPTLIEETEKIMNAQKSRGADFSSGSLIKRAKALIPIIIPLFVSSFKRADELAVAMECRCYRGDKNRTKLVKLEFRGRDYAWFGIGLVFLAAVIALMIIPSHITGILPETVYNVFFYKI
ncbi:MAG: energy-coupling factor transporter transmembrane protein EcfT [Clostridia bacterium]|nr:energy-coupling factor transporter transmembrane protein EcfT [Clostridia bacterium]